MFITCQCMMTRFIFGGILSSSSDWLEAYRSRLLKCHNHSQHPSKTRSRAKVKRSRTISERMERSIALQHANEIRLNSRSKLHWFRAANFERASCARDRLLLLGRGAAFLALFDSKMIYYTLTHLFAGRKGSFSAKFTCVSNWLPRKIYYLP